jgi:hypothetical protein
MKEFPTERHFKDAVADALSEAGCSFVREFSIGNRRSECIGNAAFADFVGAANGGLKFFVEAKNCTIGTEMARAVGQCLLYRHLRPSYRAIIAVPMLACNEGIMQWVSICFKNGITLTTEISIGADINQSQECCPSILKFDLAMMSEAEREHHLRFLKMEKLIGHQSIQMPKEKTIRERVLEAAGA